MVCRGGPCLAILAAAAASLVALLQRSALGDVGLVSIGLLVCGGVGGVDDGTLVAADLWHWRLCRAAHDAARCTAALRRGAHTGPRGSLLTQCLVRVAAAHRRQMRAMLAPHALVADTLNAARRAHAAATLARLGVADIVHGFEAS
jgi:hypothetical protein